MQRFRSDDRGCQSQEQHQRRSSSSTSRRRRRALLPRKFTAQRRQARREDSHSISNAGPRLMRQQLFLTLATTLFLICSIEHHHHHSVSAFLSITTQSTRRKPSFVAPPKQPPHLNHYASRRRTDPLSYYYSFSTLLKSSTQQQQETDTNDLSSFTVKELRELVKAKSNKERGLLSRLKKKQDLINYLQEEHNNNNHKETSRNGAAVVSSEPSSPSLVAAAAADKAVQIPPPPALQNGAADDSSSTRIRKPPLGMPPAIIQTEQQPADGSSKKRSSPKDVIVEKVYQRYPPLRPPPEDSNSDVLSVVSTMPSSPQTTIPAFYSINEDIRQIYHPVFSNLWSTWTTATTNSDHDDDPLIHARNETQTSNTLVSSDMDVVFVGTASCTPGVTRGVSCTALRLNWRRKSTIYKNGHMQQVDNFQGGTWLFDAGECTQLQVQRTPSIRPSKITKIFLTHAHGDHSFGLPGLLCLMGRQDQDEDTPPVEIYGPEGLRMWLRVAIRYSVSRICPQYRVHEIMNVPMAPEWDFSQRTRRFYYKGNRGHKSRRHPQQQHGRGRQLSVSQSWEGGRGLPGEDPVNWISQANSMQLEASPLYGEIEGGRQIYPMYDHPLSNDGAPVWEVEDEDDVKVYAAPMSHGIPCLGYVVEELPRPGRLRNDYVEPIVKRNVQALKAAGFAQPMKAMAVVKNLPPGSAFTFPDGTVVTQEDAVEPPRRGRKVVICGDTCDSRAMDKLAQNATVVIHEATNAFLQGVDNKDATLRDVTRDAIIHGHSTPQMAAKFAQRVGAETLVMNHFSARYKGDISVDSLSIMMRIEQQAMQAAALNASQVVAAWDLMVLPIPQL